MTRPLVHLLATGLVAFAWCAVAAAQEPQAAPEPKMPPMPSMEGQQGDVSKPVTQIPPRKKATAVEKKTLAKETRAAATGKKGADKVRSARARRKR